MKEKEGTILQNVSGKFDCYYKYDKFLSENSIKNDSKDIYTDMQYKKLFESMEEVSFPEIEEKVYFVDFLFYEEQIFVAAIIGDDDQQAGKQRESKKKLIITEFKYDEETKVFKFDDVSYREQEIFRGKLPNLGNKLFCQRGKYVYFYKIIQQFKNQQKVVL